MIKAIVFDLDGTLIDRRAAFQSFCNYLIDKYSIHTSFEGTREELINRMIEIDANGYGGLTNFIPKLRKFWELPLTTEEFIKERNSIFGKLSVLIPGVPELLTVLKQRYKLGMITNGYSNCQRDKINTAGIAHYFDDIIVSGEVPFEKPDPEIFRLSCEHLKVEPEEMIYVGDYYPNDIAGALGAKIKPIWVTEDQDGLKEPNELKELKEPYNGLRIGNILELLEML